MGEASSRLKKSKHKSKVKQFINLFSHKKSLSIFDISNSQIQASKKWINENVEPSVKLRISSSGNLPRPNGTCDWLSAFLKYYEEFISKHSLQFKDLQDVQFLEPSFQLIKFKCVLDNKYKISGRLWIIIKDGKIYQIDLNQQYTGSTNFDISWKQGMQKFKQWDTPQVRAKYNYVQKKEYKESPFQDNTNYEKPTDWGAHYNSQVQRSNEQFRQNMNKQAREWNDYARQNANRGW